MNAADLHGLEVLRDAAHAVAAVVEDRREEVPELELADHLLAGDGDAVLVGEIGVSQRRTCSSSA
jgi:hypothetical protein